MNRREMLSVSVSLVASLPTFGGPATDWGSIEEPPHPWTPEDVNASGFGFAIPPGSTVIGVQLVRGDKQIPLFKDSNNDTFLEATKRVAEDGLVDGFRIEITRLYPEN